MAIRVNSVDLGFGRNRDIQLERYFQDLGFSYKFWLDIPFKAETYLWVARGPPECTGNSLELVTGALCGYKTVDNGFHIEYIAAHKNCKGRRVGEALMNQALTDLKTDGIESVTLSAVDQDLPRFYAKFGFTTKELRGGITAMERRLGGRIHTRRSVRKSRRQFTRSAGRSRKQGT